MIAPPPPPPRARTPLNDRSSSPSPSIQSRPSSPNFLSQSTNRSRPAPTLSLGALLNDVETLKHHPTLFASTEFQLVKPDQDPNSPRITLETLQRDDKLVDQLTREQAVELANEILGKIEHANTAVDQLLNERDRGQGQMARVDHVEEWTERVRQGLGV
ncbi:uncharacterized protein JCM15063_000035 [Sporobolomyces koalae]|uniref:uncharacterized protein n=1 Tax=Sporobolomyces koalae TaxID=500713 RepID=UPI00317C3858